MSYTGLSDIIWPEKLWITGTDTDVGKTVVSAHLVLKLKAYYWKPIQSGRIPFTDSEVISSVTGIDKKYILPERYILNEPLSPHESSKREGIEIALDDFHMPEVEGPLIIEGAGGVCVPINKSDLMIDLFAKLKAPVIVVARSGLGTINHTVLTVEKLRERGVEILGVIMNGVKHPHNKSAIETYAKVKVLFELEPVQPLNKHNLLNL